MIVLEDLRQGSDEWLQARCGVVTMSHASELLTGGKGVTRHNYILDVAAERISGQVIERIKTDDMLRGNELEPYALAAYESEMSCTVNLVGFACLDEARRIGASPDGLLGATGARGVEIKCPNPRTHMRYIEAQRTPAKHLPQMQGNMLIFGAQSWDFVSFCPEFTPMPFVLFSAARDEEMIAKIAESAQLAVLEIDALADLVASTEYRDKSSLDEIVGRAKQHIDSFFSNADVKL